MVLNYLEYEAGVSNGQYKPRRAMENEKNKAEFDRIKPRMENIVRHTRDHMEKRLGQQLGDNIIETITPRSTDTDVEKLVKFEFLKKFFSSDEKQDSERNEKLETDERTSSTDGSYVVMNGVRVDPLAEQELKKMRSEKRERLLRFAKLMKAKPNENDFLFMLRGDGEDVK